MTINMKTAIFLSIREKATRLPKKVLLKIRGRTVTEHLIDRLKLAKLPDMIIMCTSTHPDDDVLVDIAKSNGINFFRGSEDDKLDRYLKASINYKLDFMVIVDGDDIFCDPECIDNIIRKYFETNADYIVYENLPVGVTGHGVKLEALKKVVELKDEMDTEVWGGYFTETGLFTVLKLKAPKELDYPEIRMTLDYPEDFNFFKKIFEELYKINKIFTLREILELLEKNPQIIELNKCVHEKYLAGIREAEKKIRFKKVKQ